MRKVYGYARISRDEDKKNYGSIETQKNLIRVFAAENGWQLEQIFVDDDISGFIPIENRPAFYALYQLVEASCEKPIVLMKDWSRLSRNNGIAQTILTNWKRDEVELILIKEMGASFNILKDDDDIVGITTWINERYVKETSRKVRDALHERLKQGTYIAGPRYGYIKGNNGALTVNDEVKEAVQTIFDLYEAGWGTTAIAKKLNREYDYKNPSIAEAERFKKEKGRNIRRHVREYWESDMVSKILRDETYTGTLVTHKKEVKGIHGKAKKLPAEENYRFANHHEAIIEREQFERVQKLWQERANGHSSYQRGKYAYLFGGLVKCGECGAAGTGFMRRGKPHYECLNYAKYRKARCVYTAVSEAYLWENLKVLLKSLGEQYRDFLEKTDAAQMGMPRENRRAKLQGKLSRLKREYAVMQKQKIKEMAAAETKDTQEIVEESYRELVRQKIQEIEAAQQSIHKLEKQEESSHAKNAKTAAEYFDEMLAADAIPKQVLGQLVDKIVIYRGWHVEIWLKAEL